MEKEVSVFMTDYLHAQTFVISAPSGTGKTTLNRMLCERHPQCEIAVRFTTRPKRAGEVDGKHYHFVDRARFEESIKNGEMLEWAEVHGKLYGISLKGIKAIVERHHVPILEIDVQGWLSTRAVLKNVRSVFILPPSLHILWQRLEERGTDKESVRWKRFLGAKAEIESSSSYDAFIVNADLQKAYQELEDFVIGGKRPQMGPQEGAAHCRALLKEFETGPWMIHKTQTGK